MNDKIIFSGIQPSGRLNIGNYIGALSQWPKMQAENNCIFCVVDYHAITVKQDPEELRRRLLEITKTYLAAGIDPEKSIIFRQSDISAHTELAWILNCAGARIADLNKMTQFKDKAGKNQESVSVGLYDYPVLMAADILLYGTEIVPVGEDQKQHVELARDIAKRFNNDYGEVFEIPQAIVKTEGARIMSLLDPMKKMSKSDDNQNNCIALLDDIEEARKKIMRAVTDSEDSIYFDVAEKPALSNLLTIYAQLGNREIKRLEKDYKGKGYGEFKKDLADVVVKFLEDFQAKYNSISDEEALKVLERGKEKAEAIANKKLKEVKELIGIK
ncbi:tryptophan--tRNA ligase [Candidatus Falkowbacteria bacterium]|nr:tryptophan--tRNA ligase [Candidatus Falkowbacteria bacterium]NCT55035.1 tryptophan--tRNA ligase [Candidatus Falkowbacteria bacterium]